uniref:Putative dde superfamily endonuclease n=1 Tax=Anopheles darlingi TaxID=43151 RepID=A0A2M4DSA6_ANODA
MARDMKMSHTSMQKILKEDLEYSPFKKQKIHGLSRKNVADRVTRSRMLLKTHAAHSLIFSDEKLFTLAVTLNKQNDRVYGQSLRDIPASKIAVERYQNVSAVMVWGAISSKGKLPLLFIDRGVKINKEYYLEFVLKRHLLPCAKELFGDEEFCFEQDSAPADKALVVQSWCKDNLPCFISSFEWPAVSPDLNPLDFSIWGYMLGKVNNVKHMNLDSGEDLG